MPIYLLDFRKAWNFKRSISRKEFRRECSMFKRDTKMFSKKFHDVYDCKL